MTVIFTCGMDLYASKLLILGLVRLVRLVDVVVKVWIDAYIIKSLFISA